MTRQLASPGLTFVAGHRQFADWALQATFFFLARNRYLVQASDLVLHSNNREHTQAELRSWLALYPHRHKTLVTTRINSGKRCGHLQAFAAEHARWGQREWALFTHPDVQLLPSAFTMLEAFLTYRPRASFLVAPLKRHSLGQVSPCRIYS